MIRLPEICNGNPETTVLAHYRLAGISGMGIKSPDLIGAWACSDCHAEVDRRTRVCDRDHARLAHAEGVFRTQHELMNSGRIGIAEKTRRPNDPQYRYLWGVCYPTILRQGGEALAGWEAKDLHEHFLCEYFGSEEISGFGSTYSKPLRRSSKLSPLEFTGYVEFIQREAAKLGIVIPDPESA